MQIADVVNILNARILREGSLQTIEVARLFSCVSHSIQPLLYRNRISNLSKDDSSVATIVEPDDLNGTFADLLLAQCLKLRLLEDEEESTLDYGETASSKGWGAHHSNNVVCWERFFGTADFDDESEAAWGAVNSLLD